MGVFANAEKLGAVESRKGAKKKNTWLVVKDKLVEAIRGFKAANVEADAAKAKLTPFKETLTVFAKEHFIDECVKDSAVPELPVSIQTDAGEAVTFVVQNRTESTAVTDEQVSRLRALVGDDVADSLLVTNTVFSFNPFILENKRCRTAVDSLLTAMEQKLHDDGKLPLDQTVIIANKKRIFTKAILDRMVEVCDDDPAKMAEFIDIVGSSVTMFVQNG